MRDEENVGEWDGKGERKRKGRKGKWREEERGRRKRVSVER